MRKIFLENLSNAFPYTRVRERGLLAASWCPPLFFSPFLFPLFFNEMSYGVSACQAISRFSIHRISRFWFWLLLRTAGLLDDEEGSVQQSPYRYMDHLAIAGEIKS